MKSLWLDDATSVSSDVLDADLVYDDVVVGAGLTGLVTALLLARSGRKVAVLEARTVGAVTTGNSTAKVSLLQGTQVSKISSHHSDRLARSYVDANLEGQSWLVRYCDDHDIAYQRRDAYTYAAGPQQVKSVRSEVAACDRAGLPVTWEPEIDLPFRTHGAARLRDQVQINPLDLLPALADDLRRHGGVLRQGIRVLGVDAGTPCVLKTDEGEVRGANVVLASGSPILDRGLYFAKLEPMRSYAMAFAGSSFPQDMYLSASTPSRSIRTAPQPDGTDLLLIGGNGHVVGRGGSTTKRLDQLRAWTHQHFGAVSETHAWSAQDYQTMDGVPFVGKLPRGGGHVWVATGYNKWGFTNGVAAARNISAKILDNEPSWATPLRHRITSPAVALQGGVVNAKVGAHMAAGWAKAAAVPLTTAAPSEGSGKVGRRGAAPVATSTVDGTTCELSAVCTHLGGIVSWNDAERSWDCPLHGSRFAADGTVLEGPATKALSRVDGD